MNRAIDMVTTNMGLTISAGLLVALVILLKVTGYLTKLEDAAFFWLDKRWRSRATLEQLERHVEWYGPDIAVARNKLRLHEQPEVRLLLDAKRAMREEGNTLNQQVPALFRKYQTTPMDQLTLDEARLILDWWSEGRITDGGPVLVQHAARVIMAQHGPLEEIGQ